MLKKINSHGFTLIELSIALTVAAILTVIAISSYSQYVRKGRRADAINTLLSISLAEERYRSNNSQYGTLAQVWGGVTTTSEGYYTISITNVGATTYTLSAAAQGNQANDAVSGTSCTPLQITFNSGTITKSPSVCWPT